MQNRRQFFTTIIRGGIFSSLTLLSGILTYRWSESENCRQNLTCGHCGEAYKCIMPEADKFRLDQARSYKTNPKNGRAGK